MSADLDALRSALRARFVERDRVVDGLLIALLARQHVLLLGPPGTAKSLLARTLCESLEGARFFEWLLTKFSTPEELFGPVSLQALEAGRYERITDGKIPEAHVAFLDEVFKSNSAILNALLTLMNERMYHEGSAARPVPLQTLVAASNELPDEAYRSLDRFAAALSRQPRVTVMVKGYTDSEGSLSYNRSVSEFRANIIKSYLVGKGVDPVRITSQGMGPQEPIASNDTAEGRRLNRRVEIEFIQP